MVKFRKVILQNIQELLSESVINQILTSKQVANGDRVFGADYVVQHCQKTLAKIVNKMQKLEGNSDVKKSGIIKNILTMLHPLLQVFMHVFHTPQCKLLNIIDKVCA